MAKSSISADITAANSKAATLIREREEREGLGIGRARVRDVAAENQGRPVKKGKASKWSLAADFHSPSPMVDRPRTTSGSTSFHFSYTSVSKEGSPTFNGVAVSTGSFASPSPGADHSKYIERDGAAEMSMGADHASYIEREGAVEMMDVTGEISEGIERSLIDVVNENPLEDEAKMLGVEDVREGVPSIFSNISDDPFEREEYWRAVHRSEREPRKHQLLVDPSVNPTWWAQMEGWPDMNEAFRGHCLTERARYRQWQRDEAESATDKPFSPTPFQEDAEIVGRALVGARKTPGWNEIDPPVTFRSGRGGRVQFRFVAELPHEVSPEDRALIVQNFCDHLATFSEGQDGQPTGMMYTAVIHAPDAHNDRRNYHLHVIAHDRPAKWMPEHGQWDFEVAETYNHKGQDRVRYPYRQNKIGEVSQGESKTKRKGSGVDFVPAMRQRYSEIANAVMRLRGVDRQYDPRRYEEMGIERTPTKHLGTKAAALESVGVPTEVGKSNAAAIWDDARRVIEKRAREVDAALVDEQRRLVRLAQDAHLADPRDPNLRTLRILSAERESLIANVADDRRLIMTFDHLEAKAKSRAIRTRQTCLQYLTDIDRGVADRTTVSSKRQIKARWKEAQDHIESIERELLPHRRVLRDAAQDVVTREDRIRQIDSLLVPIKAAFENAERIAREKREEKDRRDRRAKDLGRRDDAELDAVRKRSENADTPAERTSGRTTSTDPEPSTTASADAPDRASSTRNTSNNQGTNDDARTNDRSSPVRAAFLGDGWIEFAPPEPGPDRAGPLSSAPSLAGLRDLSSSQLVHDGDGSEMLLLGLSSVVVERQGGGRDGVRREGDGVAADAREAGSGGGLNEARSDAPPAAGSHTASMQPLSIEGVPIAAPTIDPASSPLLDPASTRPVGSEVPNADDLPEGIAPLRPSERPRTKGAEDIANVSIDDPVRMLPSTEYTVSSPSRETTEGMSSAIPDERPDAGNQREPRRATKDATLFPLEEQRPPEKPGTPRAEFSTWDDLVGRISTERMLVVENVDGRGRKSYEVPSLDDRERSLLHTDRFSTRTKARLAAIHQSQQREIDRLVRWIEKSGRDPEQLTITDRRARVSDAPQSIHKLMRDWGIHPLVTQALRNENDRRRSVEIEAERRRSNAASEIAGQIESTRTERRNESDERQERISELMRRFPDPSTAYTAQVEQLLKLLREDAERREIERAAEAVRQDAIAREDVHRHGIELSQAYNTLLDEMNGSVAFGIDRGKRGGR